MKEGADRMFPQGILQPMRQLLQEGITPIPEQHVLARHPLHPSTKEHPDPGQISLNIQTGDQTLSYQKYIPGTLQDMLLEGSWRLSQGLNRCANRCVRPQQSVFSDEYPGVNKGDRHLFSDLLRKPVW